MALGQSADFAKEFPHPEAIKEWRDVNGSENNVNFAALQKVPVNCETKTLYPTHPQQFTKRYAKHLKGFYDTSKIRGDDYVCKEGQKKFSGPMPACFIATTAEYYVQSDLYMDRCGNFYRGFWEKTLLEKDDNDGYLLAMGRRVYMTGEAPNRVAHVRDSYEVDAGSFLFFSAASVADMQLIDRFRAEALNKDGFHFDGKSFLFLKQ